LHAHTSPSRVCVVLLTGLGDVVNGLPLVNALKDHWPGVRVTWVVEPMPAPVLIPHPSVDEVVVYHKQRGLRGVLDLRRALGGKRFDLTLNLNVYTKGVWPTLLSRASYRLGFDRGRSFEATWLASNHHLPARPRGHTLDMFLEFAEYLGVPVPAVEWRLQITPEERRKQEEFFSTIDRPVVTLVPASANHKKDWIAERWARVVDALEHDFGFRTVLLGGEGERETRIAREIVERASAKPVWRLGNPIRWMLWTIEGSHLVMGPDTGPIHVSRALEVPAIGLYGHTSPWRIGPYREYQDLWVDRYTEPGEAPDPSSFTPKRGRMEQVTVADVLDRVERARQRYLTGAAAAE
jgi:heptosyltransferase I